MKTKLLTWAEWTLKQIFKMEGESIYIACTKCNLGVRDFWEEFTQLDENEVIIKGLRRTRHWYQIELKPKQDIPLLGQPLLFKKCPGEECEESEEFTLIRIKK